MSKNIKNKIRIVFKYSMLTVIVIIVLLPLVFMLTNSFMDNDEIIEKYDVKTDDKGLVKLSFIPNKVTLNQYYQVLFRRPTYLLQFWNSILLTVPTVIIQTVIAFMAAYAFAKIKFPGSDIIFLITLILMLLPIQVTLIPNYMVLDKFNLINTYEGIIFIGIFAPFSMCLLRQYLRYIPDDSIDAAKLDGATNIQVIFKIVLPQAKGGIAAVAILSFIENWNMVELPLLLLEDEAMHPLSIFMNRFVSTDFGLSFAAGIIFMIPVLIVFFLGEKYIVLGLKMYRR